MSIENRVAVVTDTGSSIRPDSPLVEKYQVVSIPLDIKFWEKNRWISYPDTHFTVDEFYQKMRQADKLPQTSGAISFEASQHFEKLAQENRSIISIHITSRHSVAWESALLGSQIALDKYPHLLIEVIDSKQLSIGTWFLVEQAATLAQEGYPLNDINQITLESIPKVKLTTVLSGFENVVKSGRLPKGAGYIGNKLHLKPIIEVVDGEIKLQGLARTQKSVEQVFINKLEATKNRIVKLAIIHTNFKEGADLLKQTLASLYSGEINIYEAGPVLGVNAGEGGLGLAIMEA